MLDKKKRLRLLLFRGKFLSFLVKEKLGYSARAHNRYSQEEMLDAVLKGSKFLPLEMEAKYTVKLSYL